MCFCSAFLFGSFPCIFEGLVLIVANKNKLEGDKN